MAVYIVFEDEEPPHDVFVATAEAFLEAGHFDPAVVSAQTACELATELALWFRLHRGGLAEAIMGLFQSFNLANERLLRVYVAATRDEIQNEPFWARYKEHARRRHEIVHRGHRSSQEDAAASVAVAREFVAHVAGRLPIRSEP